MHDGQMNSSRRSGWFIYEMASILDILGLMGSPEACL